MNKVFIIIAREFTTRVRKKSFLVITLVVPIIFILFYAFLMWMMMKSDSQDRRIAVINESTLENPIEKINSTIFEYSENNVPQDSAASFLAQHSDYYAIMWIPKDVMNNPDIALYSQTQIPMELKNNIASSIRSNIENIKRQEVVAQTGIPDLEEKLNATRTHVAVRTLLISDDGKSKESSSEIASLFGIVAGVIIYFFIFIYASMVMKGVLEEKTNRIIEVLVSSVKPFQFLMGKIIGIASVGLLQFIIWIVVGAVAMIALQFAFMPSIDMETLRSTTDLSALASANNVDIEQLKNIQNLAQSIDPGFIIKFFCCFIFYFIGGYLVYSSLFAAIGAAVDNETDSQQFMTPLTIISVLSFYIGIAAMRSPDSSLSVWASIIPFSSPIVMLVRLPFGVPTWELITSIVVLIISFIGLVWLSSKIYRVGILMYGKKPSWKELYKWLKY